MFAFLAIKLQECEGEYLMKLLFLTPSELSDAVSEIVEKENGERLECSVGFSEEMETDVVTIGKHEEGKEVPIAQFVPQLNEHFQVNIESYDVIEVGDYGEGFAFVIK
jgi:hypothetical protein